MNPKVVGGIITGEYPRNELWCQLMHSGLDCDRLDYLIRDSVMTGVNYGHVDLDYLVRLILKGKDSVLGVDREGIHVVEHYLMGRYFHYTQVVYHRSTRAFESVAKAALAIFLGKSSTWPFKTFKSVQDVVDENAFLGFTDQQLLGHMEAEKDALGSEFATYFDVVKYRRRPKILHEERDLVQGNTASSERYLHLRKLLIDSPDDVAKALGIDGKYLGWNEASVRVEAMPSKVGVDEAVSVAAEDADFRQLIRLVDGKTGHTSLLVTDPTSVISKLADYSMRSLVVFYIEPLDESKVDLEKREQDGRHAIETAIK